METYIILGCVALLGLGIAWLGKKKEDNLHNRGLDYEARRRADNWASRTMILGILIIAAALLAAAGVAIDRADTNPKSKPPVEKTEN